MGVRRAAIRGALVLGFGWSAFWGWTYYQAQTDLERFRGTAERMRSEMSGTLTELEYVTKERRLRGSIRNGNAAIARRDAAQRWGIGGLIVWLTALVGGLWVWRGYRTHNSNS